jgi:hypothetical protein
MASKNLQIERIEADPRFKKADVMQTLERELGSREAEIGALTAEEYLGRPSTSLGDPDGRTRGNKLRLHSRNAAIAARVVRHRASAPAQKGEEPETGGLPSEVAEALALIADSRPPSRLSRAKVIEQLRSDADVIRGAIFALRPIIDALRDELSSALAQRLGSAHRQLVLSQFRAAQQLAAATDAEAELRKTVIDAGFVWRPDLLRGPQLRGALVLGSESTFDSDISRARRMLEELGIL